MKGVLTTYKCPICNGKIRQSNLGGFWCYSPDCWKQYDEEELKSCGVNHIKEINARHFINCEYKNIDKIKVITVDKVNSAIKEILQPLAIKANDKYITGELVSQRIELFKEELGL